MVLISNAVQVTIPATGSAGIIPDSLSPKTTSSLIHKLTALHLRLIILSASFSSGSRLYTDPFAAASFLLHSNYKSSASLVFGPRALELEPVSGRREYIHNSFTKSCLHVESVGWQVLIWEPKDRAAITKDVCFPGP